MSIRAQVDREYGQIHQILCHHVVKNRGDPIHGQRGVSQPQDPVKLDVLESFSRLGDTLGKLLVADGETFNLQGGGGLMVVPSLWAAPGTPSRAGETKDDSRLLGQIR